MVWILKQTFCCFIVAWQPGCKLQNDLDHNGPLCVFGPLRSSRREAEDTDHSLGLLGWTELSAASSVVYGERVLQILIIFMALTRSETEAGQ